MRTLRAGDGTGTAGGVGDRVADGSGVIVAEASGAIVAEGKGGEGDSCARAVAHPRKTAAAIIVISSGTKRSGVQSRNRLLFITRIGLQ